MPDILPSPPAAVRTLAYLCLESTEQAQAAYVHVHEIVRGLQELGWRVELFEPSGARPSRWQALAKLYRYVTVQYRLCRHLRQCQGLYVRSHPADLPALLYARLLHVPAFIEVNGTFDDLVLAYPAVRPLFPLFRQICRTAMNLGTAVIAVTEGLQEWARRQVGGKPVFVVPNGANTELFRPEAKGERVVRGDYIVFVGTLARWQGCATLIAALDDPAWPPDLKLVVAGDGVERSRFQQAAQHNPRLIYIGRKPQHEIPGLVASSVAGLSVQDNRMGRSDKGLCPLKVFETLACGVPVIVTDFPGQAELVKENHCGLVIPAEDPCALARAASYLYANASIRRDMGRRGRRLAVAHCSWRHRACAIDRIISAARPA